MGNNPDARPQPHQGSCPVVQRAVLVFVVVFGRGRYAGLTLAEEKGRHRAAGPSAKRGGHHMGAARVLDVLEFLGRRNSPAPASIIAASCNIPRSSTYCLLYTSPSPRD